MSIVAGTVVLTANAAYEVAEEQRRAQAKADAINAAVDQLEAAGEMSWSRLLDWLRCYADDLAGDR